MNLGSVGKKGEDMVATFLRKQGCEILKRNYICRYGEVDIIAQKGNLLLFVEVKTRQENAFVKPQESVDARKQQRVIFAAQDYMVKCGISDLQPRFDVASVTVFKRDDGNLGYNLDYIKNAF